MNQGGCENWSVVLMPKKICLRLRYHKSDAAMAMDIAKREIPTKSQYILHRRLRFWFNLRSHQETKTRSKMNTYVCTLRLFMDQCLHLHHLQCVHPSEWPVCSWISVLRQHLLCPTFEATAYFWHALKHLSQDILHVQCYCSDDGRDVTFMVTFMGSHAYIALYRSTINYFTIFLCFCWSQMDALQPNSASRV